MRAAVVVFPGSNCDRDVAVALTAVSGKPADMIWHGERSLPDTDLIVLPGGFSYGDYLRSGAMAAQSPIMKDVVAKAKAGTPVLGICNGFQILTESELLPGALMRNRDIKFLCKDVYLKVERGDTMFTGEYSTGDIVRFPIAHHDGNFFADEETIERLEGEGQVAFRYASKDGEVDASSNHNGSINNIAGIYDDRLKVLGLMPHPERLIDKQLGGVDGIGMFASLMGALQ